VYHLSNVRTQRAQCPRSCSCNASCERSGQSGMRRLAIVVVAQFQAMPRGRISPDVGNIARAILNPLGGHSCPRELIDCQQRGWQCRPSESDRWATSDRTSARISMGVGEICLTGTMSVALGWSLVDCPPASYARVARATFTCVR
jgi:hypothetical protein